MQTDILWFLCVCCCSPLCLWAAYTHRQASSVTSGQARARHMSTGACWQTKGVCRQMLSKGEIERRGRRGEKRQFNRRQREHVSKRWITQQKQETEEKSWTTDPARGGGSVNVIWPSVRHRESERKKKNKRRTPMRNKGGGLKPNPKNSCVYQKESGRLGSWEMGALSWPVTSSDLPNVNTALLGPQVRHFSKKAWNFTSDHFPAPEHQETVN